MNSMITADMCAKIALVKAQVAGNPEWNNYRAISGSLSAPDTMTITLLKGNIVMWESEFNRFEVGRKTLDDFGRMLAVRWPQVFLETEAKRIEREAEEAKTVNQVRQRIETILHDVAQLHAQLEGLKKMLGDLQ